MKGWGEVQGMASVVESNRIDRITSVCLSHVVASPRCGQRTGPDPSCRTAAPVAGTG